MKVKLTRNESLVVDYIARNGSITVKEASENLGTTELRKVISNLKEIGYKVGSFWMTGENRYGVKTRFKRYFILEKPCA